jgi:4-hydroxy-2-oxoglutarate aldolase
MSSIKEKLEGVFPPVMTPFVGGMIDFRNLPANIEKRNPTRLRGYMPLGSNGEFRSLTDDEALSVVKIIAGAKGSDKTLMVGTGRESAYATIEFTKRAADLGIDFASILTPHYYAKKMTDLALVRFFTEVADASPIPILMYCAPGFAAGVVLSPPGQFPNLPLIPNIVGMKDTSKEDIAAYVRAIPAGAEFSILAGSLTKFYYGLQSGAIGGVLSMANYLPELCCELQDLFNAGKMDEAEKLSARLVRLNEKTTGKYGVAGVKAAMDLLGYYGMEPRIPLLPLTEEEREELQTVLRDEGFLK